MFFKKVLIAICRPIKRCAFVLKNFFSVAKVSNAPCFYLHEKRKNAVVRFLDVLFWLIKKGDLNRFYTQYGLDIKGSSDKEFIGFWEFARLRNSFNQIKRLDNSTGVLRDKFLFFKYMTVNHFPVPEVFGFQRNHVLYDTCFNEISLDQMGCESDFFVKDISGECASFVKHVKDYQHLLSLMPNMDNGSFLYQRRIFQHPEMDRLNPAAVNTIRIVTINENGNPYLFAAILRVGTKKSGCADNTSAGGIALGIHEDGSLFEQGMQKPQYGTMCKVHPDTGVVFATFKIPYYKDAVEMVCRAHRFFYNVRSIGWDVAISETGPVVIEGNDNWEITSIQAIYGGKKSALLKIMNEKK